MQGDNFNTKTLFFKSLKRSLSMLMVAIMLGVSNVILEEDRNVNDTRVKTEVLEFVDEDSNIQ